MKLVCRLFRRIFLWFWLALTLIGAIGVILVLTTDPRAAERKRHQEQLIHEGTQLVAAFGKEGATGVDSRGRALRPGEPVFLLREHSPLGSAPFPEELELLAQQALNRKRIQFERTDNELWAAVPITNDYVYLRTIKQQGPLAQLFNPHSLGPRLVVTFLVSGLVCYLLARSLTAPLLRLRHATREFANGDLSIRVANTMHGNDEIAELGRDFDAMAERIAQLIASQRTLLRDISHELRSPLTRLSIALELARHHSGPELAAPLDRIGREAERLNQLISRLMTLTLLESGTEQLRPEPVALHTLIEEIVADALFEAKRHNRQVLFTADTTATLHGSAELLRQAIENVVRNAIRHTPEHSVVNVTMTREGEEVRIRVRDQGPGVPDEALDVIFVPFFRVENARDRQSGGKGIGLAITKRAVCLHGGTVTASNAPGGGLQVEITLPL